MQQTYCQEVDKFLVKRSSHSYLLFQNATREFNSVLVIPKLRNIFSEVGKLTMISDFCPPPFRKRCRCEPVIVEHDFPWCQVEEAYADVVTVSLMPRFSRILPIRGRRTRYRSTPWVVKSELVGWNPFVTFFESRTLLICQAKNLRGWIPNDVA